MAKRALVICPGRGTYTKTELGYLKKHAGAHRDWLDSLDRELLALGQPSVSELDGAASFSPARHTPGEFASTLIYACGVTDYLALSRDKLDVVAVTGNSMGWYTCLRCADALDDAAAFKVVHSMGSMMKDGVIGGQLVYPIVDSEWRISAEKQALVAAKIAAVRALPGVVVHPSIHFGGYAVIGGNEVGIKQLMAALPPLEDGKYPLKLVNHAAFHTPLLAEVAARAQQLLPAGLFRSPTLPMIDGRGAIWQPGCSDTTALWRYTLGHQVSYTYDFTLAVGVALKEFAPDCLVLLGPGSSTGGAVAQILIHHQWFGIRNRAEFQARQEQDPVVLAMGRPEQRSLCV